MGAEKRIAERKSVDYISICDLTSLNNYTLIATHGYITDASTAGFLLILSRADLAQKELRENLNLDCLVGQDVDFISATNESGFRWNSDQGDSPWQGKF